AFQRCALKDCVQRELHLMIDKEQQRADWSGPLTDAQLAYAALDADLPRRLYAALLPQSEHAQLTDVLRLEERALLAFVWLADRGVPFDRAAWQSLADGAHVETTQLREQLDTQAPARPGTLEGTVPWNWNSNDQVKEVLALVGI